MGAGGGWQDLLLVFADRVASKHDDLGVEVVSDDIMFLCWYDGLPCS
jgi:hypothetical protein